MAAGEAGDWNSILIPHSALLYIAVALIGVIAGDVPCRLAWRVVPRASYPQLGGFGLPQHAAPKGAEDDEHLFGVHDLNGTPFYGHHHHHHCLLSLKAAL